MCPTFGIGQFENRIYIYIQIYMYIATYKQQVEGGLLALLQLCLPLNKRLVFA